MATTAKPRILIFFTCWVMVALLCACGGEGRGGDVSGNVSTALCEIDSMMWRQPDSAFLRLQEFAGSPEADSLSEFDGHYFQLLLSELLYKNYCSQTNREELLRVVEYFDSLEKKFPFLDARAHYIKGVGYYETDSVVEACGEYFKALEIMEEHFQKKDFVGKKAQFLSLTYNRLGDLFSGQFMMQPSIVFFEQAYHYCLIEPTSSQGLSKTLLFIGKQYDKMGDYDRARCYYEQALEELKSTDNCLYRDIVASRALSDYLSGIDTERPFDDLRQMLSQAADDGERLTRFLAIGTLFLEEKMFDSAVMYLEPVFELWEDSLVRIQAAEYLHHAYLMTNDEAKADEYARFLAFHATESYNNAATTSRLEKAFQSFTDNKQGKKAARERKASVLKTLKIVVPTAIALTVLLLIVVKRRNRKALESERKTLEETMEKERYAHKIRRDALSGRLIEKNQEVSKLKKEIVQLKKQQQDSATLNNADNPDERFHAEPICKKILDKVEEGKFKSKIPCIEYKSYALKKQDLQALRSAANLHYGKFTIRLKSRYPRLSNSDLDYCCLYLLGLTEADLAALLQRSYNTVIERSGKLRSIFGGKGPVPDILKTILFCN